LLCWWLCWCVVVLMCWWLCFDVQVDVSMTLCWCVDVHVLIARKMFRVAKLWKTLNTRETWSWGVETRITWIENPVSSKRAQTFVSVIAREEIWTSFEECNENILSWIDSHAKLKFSWKLTFHRPPHPRECTGNYAHPLAKKWRSDKVQN
jgi:hypothetical protein